MKLSEMCKHLKCKHYTWEDDGINPQHKCKQMGPWDGWGDLSIFNCMMLHEGEYMKDFFDRHEYKMKQCPHVQKLKTMLQLAIALKE